MATRWQKVSRGTVIRVEKAELARDRVGDMLSDEVAFELRPEGNKETAMRLWGVVDCRQREQYVSRSRGKNHWKPADGRGE